MKNLIQLFLVPLVLVGCTRCGRPETTPVVDAADVTGQVQTSPFLKDAKIVSLGGVLSFILKPTVAVSGPTKWVWYAPAFVNGATPEANQHGYYVAQLRAQGFAVVGCDVGESYGSPAGRAAWWAFYSYLKANGFESSGVFLLQSRGGLMGYTFLREHPEAAKAVAGIYPLLSFNDYVGPTAYAPAWGMDLATFNATSPAVDPLLNAASFSFPIYHVHGSADLVTSYANDVAFVAAAPNAVLETAPGQAHEFYTPEFFHNDNVLNFIQGVQ